MDRKHRMNRCFGVLGIVLGLCLLAGGSSAQDEKDEDGWTGEVNASLNAQTGTTDTFSGALDAGLERVFDEVDEVAFGFSGAYGRSRERNDDRNDETTQNAQRLFGNWKHIIHERYFWESETSAARDTTQDLEIRYILTTGPGYRFWEGEDGAKEHFDVSVGPGYRFELYDGNTGGTVSENGDTDHFADVVLTFEYKNMLFEDRVEYTHTGSARMPANDVGAYLLRSEMVVGVPITEAWSFRTAFLVEYTADPGSDEVNNTLTRTTVGLGYKF